MSDDDKKPARKPLTLKGAQPGEVKQTFSHGRTNKVAVEVKRRRKLVKPGETPPAAPPPPPPPPPAPEPAPAPVAKKAAPKKPAAPADETPQERVARLQREAEEDRLRQSEDARKREEEQARQAAEDQKKRAEEKRKAEEEAAKAATEEAQKPAQQPAEEPAAAAGETAAETPAGDKAAAGTPSPAPRRFTPVARPEPKKPERKKKDDKAARTAEKPDKRRAGKLTVNKALNEDEGRRARSLAALKRAREKERRMQGGPSKPREKQVRDVIVPEAITVGELAKRMGEKGADLVKELFNLDMMVTVNQTIDQDTAELLVDQFGHNIQKVSEADVDIANVDDVDPPETLKPRPAVVTIMGHVDHGKTSLLDALRGANVVKGEAGGITQHIGSYQVNTKGGDTITFLDTPGHAAFTEMRQRGANVTDIVVLVVAADDGIMPQTIEAINHTKAAGVPMIVAINKMDKPEANPDNIRTRLLEHEVIVEKMSGDVQDVEISAKEKSGLDKLLDAISLQAELLELKANPDRMAEATVIEAQLDKGRGPVATVLVTRGTLERGNTFVVGTQSGRVRAIVNDQGKQIKKAGPSMPVEVLGLGGVPSAGDVLSVVENEQRAREVAEYRQEKATEKRTALAPTSFDTMFNNLASNVVEFPVLVKADVQGSVEAITTALHNLSNDLIKVRVLHAGVGAITESDVQLAAASNAPIIGFNVRPNAKARELVKRDGVEMKYYDVIYHLTEEIAKEMAGELGPERIEHVVGRAAVKEVFRSGKKDKAAGLLVEEGVIRKGLFARLTRDDVIVSATTIASLRRFKDDVDEVRAGLECGVVLADTNDIKAGDQLEVFEVEERERTL
ncbi:MULTISPECIES: translation initiation factor IF-2 [Erythrobacteraceae]|jgi:translation initiation factor IF-2|uniref:Translation initiation factor IF-2 n=2 Tax=Erythrobacteraceae TaxID=335929 RepID=A0A0L1KEG9_9SPHN|nr:MULTISPECIES: translation initiation factor IF-2 [Erythrobacteraceae]HAV80754.1 translation initiation factor IF-2 [Erythrobacter sp.]KNH02247.1 translation initiation factor if-2 [Qipengyuania citrea LAMA 915]KZY90388.1 translation initiation factor IF-2 [Erythrobacter sp. HI0074]KZZ07310.1 translation initiation factor IF-2 [Erythrobacter sp. HI0077]HCC27968.1 translation initiation factor IF-2 [Erythrobacter sp.]|tara:strand:+ start:1309 stop:3852 length:2544 start_codon:yes stop_codon:yes gene_type:complete